MAPAFSSKRAQLVGLLSDLRRVVVAYSGGVDSTFLTAVAHETLGQDCLAVTAVSPSLARRELAAARSLARGRGWSHVEVGTHEVARDEYARNAPDRCYWCKTELFETLAPIAEERGAEIVVGTNLDDLSDFRPGLRAAKERAIRAPLVEAGLTKGEIRSLSKDMGLPTADKPSSPCLSSRFAYGVRVTPAGLRRVERAEDVLWDKGFTDVRVRDHGDLARIEVPLGEIDRAAELRDEITGALTELGYRYVSLDPAGLRSGAMNEVLAAPRLRR